MRKPRATAGTPRSLLPAVRTSDPGTGAGGPVKPAITSQPPSRAERLLSEFHEERPLASQALDLQMLRDLLPYARPYLKLYLGSLLLMPVGVATQLVQPRLIERAVNAVGL